MPAKSKSADAAAMVSEDAIRQRAYYLWEADGRPEGQHDHYWARAHAEATRAFVEATSDGVAKAAKSAAGPTKTKASKATKDKVKEVKPAKAKAARAEEPKPAKKATPKPRAAVPAAKKAK